MVTLEGLRGFLSLPPDSKMRFCTAAMYYDNRGMGQIGADDAAQRMINSFVLELRYAGEDYGQQ